MTTHYPKLFIESERLILRRLSIDDVNDQYLSWMNNPNIYQFLEAKQGQETIEGLRSFVSSVLEDDDNIFLASVHRDESTHIGNIKLGPINLRHRNASLGFIIGDVNYWGQGLATEAISLLCKFAIENLPLRLINASCYSNNIGSIRALTSSGFQQDGINKEKVLFVDGTRKDVIHFVYWIDVESNL